MNKREKEINETVKKSKKQTRAPAFGAKIKVLQHTVEKVGAWNSSKSQKFLTIHKKIFQVGEHIPAFSSKQRPRDKVNAIENIDQSENSFKLDWRELHNIDVHSLSTFVAAKLCLSRLCFPFTLAKWIARMPNKGKKEKVMFQASCVSFILAVSALNMVMSTLAIMTDRLFDHTRSLFISLVKCTRLPKVEGILNKRIKKMETLSVTR